MTKDMTTLKTAIIERFGTPCAVIDLDLVARNIVKAQEGEGFEALSDRTKNAWGGQETAVFNGVMVTHKYNDGDLVKIAVRKTYSPGE